MTSLPLQTIATALGQTDCSDKREIRILLTDSRKLTFAEETLFFALTTPKRDAHRFIPQLYSRGVRAFVVSEAAQFPTGDFPDATFLTVSDTLEALRTIGRLCRNRLTMPVIGITGSNGKTTTKELLHTMLSRYRHVTRSPRSYNSAIGVPLALWSLDADADLALVEAGISRPGEMKAQADLICPDLGLLTHLGTAHLEHFANRRDLIREKLHLFAGCDTVYSSLDLDPEAEEVLREGKYTFRLRGWSRVEADEAILFVEREVPTPDGLTVRGRIRGKEVHFDLPFLDDGSIEDCYLALSVLFDLVPEASTDDLSFTRTLRQVSMRLETLEGEQGMTILSDVYNADLDSLSGALAALRRRQELTGKPTAVILGDFKESSHDQSTLYTEMGRLLDRFDIDETLLVGSEIGKYRSAFAPSARHYARPGDLLGDRPEERLADHIVLIKGARETRLEEVVRRLTRTVHQTILSVNLSRLGRNLDRYRTHLPTGRRITCMLKAGAYGLGSEEVARFLEQYGGVDYFAVALCDEGKELRRQGLTTPIMVMNPEPDTYLRLMSDRLEPNIFSLRLLRDFIAAAERYDTRHYPIHLKWNTGMNRTGFDEAEVDEVIRLVRETEAIRVASIFTHLAVADDPTEDAYTHAQLAMLDRIEARLRASLPYPFLKHALNTAGITRFPDYPSEMVRLGCGLYGLSPLENDPMGLEPVASLSSIILQTRLLPAGATVGYGRKGLLKRDSRIGVIPIGYADGLPRQLGNGRITFRTESGIPVPTIGNVCMDALMLDLTDDPTAVEGSRITLFDDRLPITRLAEACDTIHYEILSRLSPRIARHYYTE